MRAVIHRDKWPVGRGVPVTINDFGTYDFPPFVHHAFDGCLSIAGYDLSFVDVAGQQEVFIAALNARPGNNEPPDLAAKRAAAKALSRIAGRERWGFKLVIDWSLWQ